MTGIRDRVVVGVDGSPESLAAARWAAEAAQVRRLAVELLHAYTIPAAGTLGYTVPVALTDGVRDFGEEVLATAEGQVRAEYPGLTVTVRMVHADPRPALVEASASAALTVVGTRGGGRIPEVILGSAALHVAAHGRSPVAVIPAATLVEPRPARSEQTGPIVLGVDGSATSEAAVEFAFDEADRRSVPLRAVLAWDDAEVRGLVAAGRLLDQVEDDRAHAVIAEQLAGWREKYPDVVVEQVVRRGRATEALLRQDPDEIEPEMIVVGSRGRGGFAGLLLGSTSHSLIGHSRRPVVVVRPER